MTFKPILFNTEMVRAILEGRKTKTRRVIKDKYFNPLISDHKWRSPVDPGDILWVRETWNVNNLRENELTGKFEAGFIYAASDAPPHSFQWAKVSEEDYQKYEDGMSVYFSGWRPSIHMPKEAARIFLLSKSVTCERLQQIDGAEAEAEGVLVINNPLIREDKATYDAAGRTCFARVWNDTLSRDQAVRVGWERNPWVFVIEFERVDKPAEWEEYVK